MTPTTYYYSYSDPTSITAQYSNNPNKNDSNNEKNLPVQAMLTCYYSTNNDWCRNYIDLLDVNRMKALKEIPCIAIQGGSDGICPPDSALDLLEAWTTAAENDNNYTMELRMPVHGGHSMYDPLIQNELLHATDRMADELTRISSQKNEIQ